MQIKIALAGNPNSGKTTLFNALTGSNQFVGNWPGVTVEKKEGKLKNYDGVIITDLPGIYSLSPYSLEEVVARNYLLDERPSVILNIVDGTNLERNLYLTTQLTEIGIPVVIAVNMMDVVRKSGNQIDIKKLAEKMSCRVFEISALKNQGIAAVAEAAIEAAQGGNQVSRHIFSGVVEHALAYIEEAILHDFPPAEQRWYAVKIFERDEKVRHDLNCNQKLLDHVEKDIADAETELDDTAESIIINERYQYIAALMKICCKKQDNPKTPISAKIDSVVTNRWAALPIFAAVMFLVYYISITTVGAWATDWMNDGVFGEGWHLFGIDGLLIPGIPVVLGDALTAIHCAAWLQGLILDGIVAGVGAVLGFLPQMFVLFFFLAFLEGCGYMARIAFMMDRIFRKFGLSGKSFIPMLIGTGCGVPGIMASRTIENQRDRRMTIMTTTFIPCGAKLPIIALIAGAMFGGAWWVAPSAYFIGVLAVIISGIILKKTRLFAGDVAPFIMELPAYHWPTGVNLFRSVWERGCSFIKKAGTVILLATVVIWFASNFGWEKGAFGMVPMENSILAAIGSSLCVLFAPLGWGNWQGTVATITGLIAKENVVGTFGVLFGGFDEVAENGWQIWANLRLVFTPLAAYSFLLFNLLCAPCFAAMGAIRREMNSAKWTLFAIGYQCAFAYAASLIVYQLGMVFIGHGNPIGAAVAILLLACFVYLLLRPNRKNDKSKLRFKQENQPKAENSI